MDELNIKRPGRKELSEVQPTKTISEMYRILSGLGIQVTDPGLRKQVREHNALIKKNGMWHLNVPYAISHYKFEQDGKPLVQDDGDLDKRRKLALTRKAEADARIRVREDNLAAGEVISVKDVNNIVRAPAIKFHWSVLNELDKLSKMLIEIVGGDQGKSNAMAKELRFFIKQKLAAAYADKPYQLTIDKSYEKVE